MRRFLFAIALLLLAGTPAVADRASECRRQCGDDAACYRRCMGYSYHHGGYHHSGSPYWRSPSSGAGQPRAYRRAPSVEAPSPARPSESGGGGPAERPSILGTAYDFLYAPGAETAGYGLYSYVILPRPGDRAVAFLREIVGHFPAASNVAEAKQRINILYLPTKAAARGQAAFDADAAPAVVKAFLDKNYDFAMARDLLFHLCDRPAPAVAQLCANDLSGGPYILTYATKVSDLSPLPPPFLFVDLTNVRPRAFPLFVAAYAAQVKRPNFSDGERLADFRLQLLNIILTAADWVQPVSAAVADIAHFAEAAKSDGETPK
jgi:hypothetical protein